MENIEKEPRTWHFLSSFALKLIAILTMTLDHLGLLFSMYYFSNDHPLVLTFRIIGRLALPLFCFMIYEGTIHTKHFGKYALRLLTLTVLISISLAVMHFAWNFERDFGNIFIDLLLGAVGVYCLKHKNPYIKLLALLPIGYAIGSSFAAYYELNGTLIHWFPFFLRTQYHYYGVFMIYGFYGVSFIKDLFMDNYAKNSGLDKEVVKDTPLERTVSNILSLLVIFMMTFIYYFMNYGLNLLGYKQLFAIISGALLLFYNGKRGYNSKWFQYGCYIYYPLHIVIMFLIFYLLNL